MLENNKIFNALAQHIHEAVVCLSFDFKVLFLNKTGEKIFNCRENTAIGMDFSLLCTRSAWSNLLEQYIAQIKSKHLPLVPIEIKRNHEKVIWIAAPLADEKAQKIGFILIGDYHVDLEGVFKFNL